jgi:hypothetical protein
MRKNYSLGGTQFPVACFENEARGSWWNKCGLPLEAREGEKTDSLVESPGWNATC